MRERDSPTRGSLVSTREQLFVMRDAALAPARRKQKGGKNGNKRKIQTHDDARAAHRVWHIAPAHVRTTREYTRNAPRMPNDRDI